MINGWLSLLPAGSDETTIRETARTNDIALGNFALCWQRPNAPGGLIIGFGATPTTDLPDALAALRQVLGAV